MLYTVVQRDGRLPSCLIYHTLQQLGDRYLIFTAVVLGGNVQLCRNPLV